MDILHNKNSKISSVEAVHQERDQEERFWDFRSGSDVQDCKETEKLMRLKVQRIELGKDARGEEKENAFIKKERGREMDKYTVWFM